MCDICVLVSSHFYTFLWSSYVRKFLFLVIFMYFKEIFAQNIIHNNNVGLKKKKNLVTNSCTIMRTHATIQTFKMKWKSFEFNLLSVFIITFDWFHSLSIRAVICKAAQCLSTWHNTWGNGPSLKKSSSVCNQSNQ